MILGFIRPEYDYVSKEALVEDIKEDIRVAKRSLEREGYQSWKEDAWLKGEEEEKGNVKVRQAGQMGGVVMCEMGN